MAEKLTIEERNVRRVEMLDEIDLFCRQKGLRYSLASGTLLGAIRHKGYIPWDDDMDIMMPAPDLLRFKNEFVSDTQLYIDIDNEPYYSFAFSRVVDKNSYSKPGKVLIGPGLEIDVYPVVGLPSDKTEIDDFFFKGEKMLRNRLFIMKWRSRLIRRFPVKTVPFFHRVQQSYHDYVFSYQYGQNGYYLVHSGELDWAHTYDFNLFESVVDVDFEGHRFMAISRYDEYLKQRYGDYMQLPPVDQRKPYHGGIYYKK